MQKVTDFALISPTALIAVGTHGWRAKCLQRLVRLDMPVPRTVALSFAAVRALAAGQLPDTGALIATFGESPLVSVRPSSENPDWGGPSSILNIGMNDARHRELSLSHGEEVNRKLYFYTSEYPC